ncbi:MAG: glycoside hydrolase family 108 protein [Betaproteobacteria bacterium]|jgi:lysozyme family protein
MRETFLAYMPQLFKHEGGYVDHPRDPGGATNLGITLRTLYEWRGRGVTKHDVKTLTKDEAERIYKARYWDAIKADGLLAGPDAMLFDVAVNSGVGRAKQWMPIIAGKSAAESVKAIGSRRRAFFRSLRTFDVFGKGWMRRVAEVEAWSLAWAVRWQGGAVKPVLEKEAEHSRRNSQAAGGGAVATGGGAIAAPQAEAAAGIDWLALAAVGVPIALLFAFLIYQALMQGARAKAMKEAANV